MLILNEFPEISCAILSGGSSSRMGKDKAMLKMNNKMIFERTIGTVRTCISDLMIISNLPTHYTFLDLPVYQDIIPEIENCLDSQNLKVSELFNHIENVKIVQIMKDNVLYRNNLFLNINYPNDLDNKKNIKSRLKYDHAY
tara:strand:+ start:83 stop:505 length:423 start_codon:yes stop_codon:yes gene_type:complete